MVELTRRSLVASALLSPLAAQAQQGWPSGTIRIVVPFPAGGSVDTISRLVQTGCSSGSARTSSSRTGRALRDRPAQVA
jgi:tripartite-type tricarboxylate transporter receptor subunit TctC